MILGLRSRSAPERSALAARYLQHNVPDEGVAGALCVLRAEVENTGRDDWPRSPADQHYAGLGVFADGALLGVGRANREVVRPGERATFLTVVTWPARAATVEVRLDLMINDRTWFSDAGVPAPTVALSLREAPPTRTETLMAVARAHDPWFFAPGLGVHRSRAGRPLYPLFAESARGAIVTDVDGREFVDMVMGWGSCLLGHAEPRVQQAMVRSLEGSALPTLAHRLEIEVAAALCEDHGFGDHVVFGKNGSDVTTWAVRAARLYTGRRTIVFAGFHGWQDWNASLAGFGATGIPWDAPRAWRIRYRDVDALEAMVAAHADDLAAVVVEPAATARDADDPYHERDAPYLRRAQELARRHRALFVLDEIFTGFRFRGGSAQRHYGLEPDLTCLGKALANGMPLAALVGRSDVLPRTVERLQYLATYRGEAHSYAAAREALRALREDDVASRVWAVGDGIRREVDAACRRSRVPARLVGPPYRMYFAFEDGAPEERVGWRTLLQQELARHGLISHKGYVIPSLRHEGAAAERCVAAYGAALETIGEARRRGTALPFLDIPDVAEEAES